MWYRSLRRVPNCASGRDDVGRRHDISSHDIDIHDINIHDININVSAPA